MGTRWFGMTIVAMAILLGTPVAVSFLPGMDLRFRVHALIAAPPNGSIELFLCQGTIAWNVDREVMFGWKALPPPVTWWTWQWKRDLDITRIRFPVWPLIPTMGVIGAWAWRRGSTCPGDVGGPIENGVWRSKRSKRAGSHILMCTGLVTVSAVVFSCLTSGMVWIDFDKSNYRSLNLWGLSGGCWVWRFDPAWDPAPGPRYGPLSAWWRSDGEKLSIAVPVWPLPMAALGVGSIMVWRDERSRLWSRRGYCKRCGYPLISLPRALCPECGTESCELIPFQSVEAKV